MRRASVLLLVFLFHPAIVHAYYFRRGHHQPAVRIFSAAISAARGGKEASDDNNNNSDWITNNEDAPLSVDDEQSDYLEHHPLLQVPCSLSLRHHHHHNDEGAADTQQQQQQQEAMMIRTYCDTGAQRTVMSWDCAQANGLLQHLDRRYAGHATGVGSCRVLGRIPAGIIQLQFSSSCSNALLKVKSPPITIIESTGTRGVDLLLGLDFLRDYQAVLNLPKEELTMTVDNQEYHIPFVRPSEACTTALYGGCTNNNKNDNDEWMSDDDEDDEPSDNDENLDMSGV